MPRERLEVADIFRAYGPVWRKANADHLSLGQLKASPKRAIGWHGLR